MKSMFTFTFSSIKPKFLLPVAFVLFAALTAVSCNSDDENAAVITEAEAAAAITNAIEPKACGLLALLERTHHQARYYQFYTETPDYGCDNGFGGIYGRKTLFTDPYSYDYNGNFSFVNICDAAAKPEFFNMRYSLSGYYYTSRIHCNNSFEADLLLSDLLNPDTGIFRGSYTRNTVQEDKENPENSFSGVIQVDINNVTVKKTIHEINGTADVYFTGTANDGTVYNYNGTITFTDYRNGVLVINNHSYPLKFA